MSTLSKEHTIVNESQTSARPLPLPFCSYPTAGETAQHGLQVLPAAIPLVDFDSVRPYRSFNHRAVLAAALDHDQLLQMARLVAAAFATREPMARHIRPPQFPPVGLSEAIHSDPFGSDPFGPWTAENIIYWYIRLFLLTDPASPAGAVRLNEEVLDLSIAILGADREVIAASINEVMSPPDMPPIREDDIFIAAVLSYLQPIFDLLGEQNTTALQALCGRFPEFRAALALGKVGHQVMGARSEAIAPEETSEITTLAFENYQKLGFEYVATEASNQWSGASYEILGAIRVHFLPFRLQPTLPRSAEPLAGVVSSPDGFIAAKDSGCMFYLVRLN